MSSIRGINPRAKFLGNRISEWTIDAQRDTYQAYEFGSEFPVVALGQMQISVYLNVIGGLHTTGGLFEGDLFYSKPHAIGKGAVCPHCGDYNPAGLAHCHRCSAPTEWRPDAGIYALPLLLQSISTTAYDDSLVTSELEFVSDGETSMEQIASLFGLDTEDHQKVETQFFWGQTGYYRCQYCGQAVKDGDVCPSCGGTRIPWSEILQMDRECIYCGTKVVGGIVCPGCGRRIAGETVSDRMGKVYA